MAGVFKRIFFCWLLFSIICPMFIGCAPAKRSSDYGRINSGAGKSFSVSASGLTEMEAENKARTAAGLYCQENKLGRKAELNEGRISYRGPFASSQQHKLVTGVMESIGDGVKIRKGLPFIGPSASVDINPKETARNLSEDAYQADFNAVCRP